MIDPVTAADMRAVPELGGLSHEAVDALAHRAIQLYVRPGTYLIRQGEIAFKLYVVLAGQATVSSSGNPIATVGPGDVLGEMALVSGNPRNADVIAATNMRLAALLAWDYADLVATHPEIGEAVARVAAQRGG